MSTRLSREEFIKRAIVKHGDRYGYDEVEYVDIKTKVRIYCKTCGKYFEQTPDRHLRGSGCLACSIMSRTRKRAKNQEQFIMEATEKHNGKYDYSLVNYVNTSTLVDIICPFHGVFSQRPANHLHGQGCPDCGFDKIRQVKIKEQDKFIEEATRLHEGKYDYSLVDYKGNKKKVKIICPKHGIFEQRPNDHLSGHGCPACGNTCSKTEDDIIDVFKPLECKKHDKTILEGQELDIVIPSLNIAVEFNGLRWHTEEFGREESYHLNKLEECRKHGIGLVNIFEDEWRNHREVCVFKLKEMVGLNNNLKIMGEYCGIREVDKFEAKKFISYNSLEDNADFVLALGAFHNGELVSLMTFRKGEETSTSWVLADVVNDIKYNLHGVNERIFDYFITHYDFVEIKVFADRRWLYNHENNLYTRLGFSFKAFIKPTYTYYNEDLCRGKRFSKESVNEDTAKESGYRKIWDCGRIEYVYMREARRQGICRSV